MRLTRWFRWLVLVIFIGVSVIVWLQQPLTPQSVMSQSSWDALQGSSERGAYLARMSGCIACHTDNESGNPALSGGKALKTPFGEFRAPNITTDKEHGIGAWTPQEFATAIREGISPDGKPYYPAFPYTFYTQFSDQDIADLWAAFQTVPPISIPATKQDISFPFSIREGLKLWRILYFQPQLFQKNPQQDAVYNRGKFIVEVAAHCGACHTPRNSLGALIKDKSFTGGYDSSQNKVPSITSADLKKKGWTQDDLAYALQTGITSEGDVFGGSMSDAVEQSTAYLSWQDLMAVSHFLLTPTTSLKKKP